MDFQSFADWWQTQVKQALVTKITSGDEFHDILARDSPNKLVCLQVSAPPETRTGHRQEAHPGGHM